MSPQRHIPALLVLVATCALVSACGSSDTTTVVQTVTEPPAAPPQTDTIDKTPPTIATVTPTVTVPAPAPPLTLRVVRRATFHTPSGNIGCVLLGGQARCDIRRRDWSLPPRPASCNLDWGQGLYVSGTGRGRVVCAGDTALDPTTAVLPYGTISRYGAFSCTSRRFGITCRNRATDHGFFLARDHYRLF